MTRRVYFLLGAAAIALTTFLLLTWPDREINIPDQIDPHRILSELEAGNARFMGSRRVLSTDTAHDDQLRHKLQSGQHPFVAIVCCADSRVCPEVIFDQRVGSFFEIRNAGNIMDEDAIASIEYAVEHLHVGFVCILGHKGCGAIEAVHEAGDKPLHDHLRDLQNRMRAIAPQVLASPGNHSAEHLDWLAQENARQQTNCLLKESAPIRDAEQSGEVRLVYGLYDMGTGHVEFFDRRMDRGVALSTPRGRLAPRN